MLGYALLSLRAQLHGAPHQIIKTVGVDRPHQFVADDAAMVDQKGFGRSINTEVNGCLAFKVNHLTAPGVAVALYPGERSEEHTSELQSRGHLVCRLLLEKKNKRR